MTESQAIVRSMKVMAGLLSKAEAIKRDDALHLIGGKAVDSRPGPRQWAHDYGIIQTATGKRFYYKDVERDYQQDLLDDTSQRIIVGKSRQLGISNTLAFMCAEEACAGGTVLVVSKNLEQAALFLQYVYTALSEAPHPLFVQRNTLRFRFDNGGMVICQPASPKAGRGVAATLVILDELAWQDYARTIFTAVVPTLSTTNGRLIILSTPNGVGNLFQELWDYANTEDGKRIWSVHYLPWWRHPDWDDAWAEEMRALLGEQEFAQEHDVDFLKSGQNVFAAHEIEGLWRLPTLPLTNVEKGIHYKAAVKDHRYVSAFDIGKDRDPFVGFTFDVSVTPFEVVAYERHLKLDYPLQAEHIKWRKEHFPGKVVVEANGVGDPLIDFLTVKVVEFTTTALTKKNAIDALKLLIQRGELASPLIEQWKKELTIYVRKDDKIVQDTVMASAICALIAGRPIRSRVDAFDSSSFYSG